MQIITALLTHIKIMSLPRKKGGAFCSHVCFKQFYGTHKRLQVFTPAAL